MALSSPAPAPLRVLLLGAGGREHALCVHLLASPRVAHVYVAPGNGGTAAMAPPTRVSNVDVPASAADGFKGIVEWAVQQQINLCIPGPEQPLVDGVEAAFRAVGIPVFGPSPLAAQMEGSKTLAKAFMARHAIPTAAFASFDASQLVDARNFVKSCGGAQRVVLKASGLAAGKGVLLPETEQECEEGLQDILVRKTFGEAGSSLLIEARLSGPELSILTFSDGYSTYSLPCCQDHKRIGEGDTGPNTGGMGAYTPAPEGLVPGMAERIERDIIAPSIAGMRRDGFPFVGLLFTGIMLTEQGPQVLEYNVRFGDPETEAALELLDASNGVGLAELMLACVERRLDSVVCQTRPGAAVSVVLASGGYPGKYRTGVPITIGELPAGVKVYHAGTTRGPAGELLTAGGRVLVVSAAGATLQEAVKLAYAGVDCISFEGMVVRRDIAHRALKPAQAAASQGGLTYAQAGVDVDAGNALVEAIKPAAKSTRRPGCDASLGGFGGVFDLKACQFRDPVLVSGTDGVGTKLRVAIDAKKHDSVGIDLVAMSVNDLLVQGAAPLYFLDYFACSKLDVPIASAVVAGVAAGCRQAHCGLIGGETAEMPGMYEGDDYDLAGFAVGAVERELLLPRVEAVQAGDVLLGLRSSGVHSNGFSLVRKIVARGAAQLSAPPPYASSQGHATLAEALLEPTRIYVDALSPLLGLADGAAPHASWKGLRALSHITGGGFTDNIPRILPAHLGALVDVSAWAQPPLFAWLQKVGGVESKEMCRTFNCGIGMVLVVAKESVPGVLEALAQGGEQDVVTMGTVQEGAGVRYTGFESWSA